MIPQSQLSVKLLPHNREAERHILGTLLCKPDGMAQARLLLDLKDFYVGANQALYGAMIALHDNGKVLDAGTLIGHLRENNKLDEVGGPEYIEEVCGLFSAAPIAGQAKTITDIANRRGAIMAALEMVKRADPPTGSLTELIDDLVAKVVQFRDDADYEWERPLPISETPSPEPFPVDVFPPSIQAFINEAAASLACPVDYVGVAALVFAAGAIGTSEEIEIKRSWKELATMYAAIIGAPGSTKTAAIDLVAKPLQKIGRKLLLDYDKEYACFEQATSIWEKNKSEAKPIKPLCKRAMVSDVTTERLAQILRDNPRGVVQFRDELTSWATSMNQYKNGKGADRQFYLSAWSGKPITVDRSKDQDKPPLTAENPFLCVVGGLPPGTLGTLRGDSANRKADDDGFFDRLLFCFPIAHKMVGANRNDISEEVEKNWHDVIHRLYATPMVATTEDGESGERGYRPNVVKLSQEARVEWDGLENKIAYDVNSEGFSDTLRAVWSKMRTYAARFALVIHCLRNASGESMTAIDGQSIKLASKLASYFLCQARRVFGEMKIDNIAVDALKVRSRILKDAEKESIVSIVSRYSVRDIQRIIGDVDKSYAQTVTNFLEEKMYLKTIHTDTSRPGKPKSKRVILNPLLFSRN